MSVRELPPLRLHALITTPNGNSYRWGQDERRPENTFTNLTFSTAMPGGFESCECSLPRKSGTSYQDLTRLSTLQIRGAGGGIAGEYRLEKTPRVSDLSERTVSPQFVGWQANLDDDPEASEVYVDRDLSHWEDMSRTRKLALYGFTFGVLGGPTTDADAASGIPALNLTFTGGGGAENVQVEGWYDAGPSARIGSLYYDMTSMNTTSSYAGDIGTSQDDGGATTSLSSDLLTGTNSSASGTFTPSSAYRYGVVQLQFLGTPGETDHTIMWRRLVVWGSHGLTKRGTAPNEGLYASDVIANAVRRWATRLHFTEGTDGTVQPTGFIIPQLEFRTPTTVSDIITQANRFHLNDWAVWENPAGDSIKPTFYYNPRNGGRGKKWLARITPSHLTETGPQVDRLWNGVIVTFQDVDGTTKSVGPTGARTDTTSTDLIDTDPENPINQLLLKRYARLDMGIVSTAAAATEVGRRFLERAKELDQSGSAEIVGHVTDDRGVVRPAWQIRAGDQIRFVDAADPSYRRIVHTSYSHDSRTCSIDLDSPPESMDALLEELSVSLFGGYGVPQDTAGHLAGSGTSRRK